jgi:hypothetical protein
VAAEVGAGKGVAEGGGKVKVAEGGTGVSGAEEAGSAVGEVGVKIGVTVSGGEVGWLWVRVEVGMTVSLAATVGVVAAEVSPATGVSAASPPQLPKARLKANNSKVSL